MGYSTCSGGGTHSRHEPKRTCDDCDHCPVTVGPLRIVRCPVGWCGEYRFCLSCRTKHAPMDHSECRRIQAELANWETAHAGDLQVLAAFGDWKAGVPAGMVGISAAIGGHRRDRSEPERWFILPVDEYHNGGPHIDKSGRGGIIVRPEAAGFGFGPLVEIKALA